MDTKDSTKLSPFDVKYVYLHETRFLDPNTVLFKETWLFAFYETKWGRFKVEYSTLKVLTRSLAAVFRKI